MRGLAHESCLSTQGGPRFSHELALVEVVHLGPKMPRYRVHLQRKHLDETTRSQVGYPVLKLAEDGGTTQSRFLMLPEADGGPALSREEMDTTWNIPTKVVWEGGEEMTLMLTGEDGGGEGGRKLRETVQKLQAAGKWFKVRMNTLFVVHNQS